jgi:hypothetical protein
VEATQSGQSHRWSSRGSANRVRLWRLEAHHLRGRGQGACGRGSLKQADVADTPRVACPPCAGGRFSGQVLSARRVLDQLLSLQDPETETPDVSQDDMFVLLGTNKPTVNRGFKELRALAWPLRCGRYQLHPKLTDGRTAATVMGVPKIRASAAGEPAADSLDHVFGSTGTTVWFQQSRTSAGPCTLLAGPSVVLGRGRAVPIPGALGLLGICRSQGRPPCYKSRPPGAHGPPGPLPRGLALSAGRRTVQRPRPEPLRRCGTSL